MAKVKLTQDLNTGKGIVKAGNTIDVSLARARKIVAIGKGEIVKKRKKTITKKYTKEDKTANTNESK